MATARKTTKTKTTKRKSKYSDEQIAEFRRLDQERTDAADAVLEDPAALERMAVALRGASARVLGYSERNQALLWTQASEQGFRLTDVDTARGWAGRGRSIRPECKFKGLRITAPRGDRTEDRKDKDGGGTDAPPKDTAPKESAGKDGAGEGGEKKRSPLFRMMSVFDIAQTQDAFADEPDGDAVGPRTAGEVADEDAELLRQAEDAEAFADELAGQQVTS